MTSSRASSLRRFQVLGLAVALLGLLGGLLVGRQVSSDERPRPGEPQAANAVAVPVVAAIATGPDAPPAPADDDPTLGLGAIIGEENIAAGSSAPATEPGPVTTGTPDAGGDSAQSAVAGLDRRDVDAVVAIATAGALGAEAVLGDTAADDPVPDDAVPGEGVAVDESSEARAAVDPCAPLVPIEVARECPDGVRSTVFADRALPDLQLFAAGRPASPDDPAPTPFTCPASDGPARFGVWATAPGVVTINYRPLTSAAWRTAELTTSDAARERWESALEDGGSTADGRIWTAWCVDLDGVSGGIAYDARVQMVDDFGRRARYNVGRVAGDGVGVRPPPGVYPLDHERLLVVVPAAIDERVEIAANYSSDRNCASADLRASDPGLSRLADSTVTREFLTSRGFLPEYTRYVLRIFRIDEGQNGAMCVGVYPDTGPSFERRTATLLLGFPFSSPDVVHPVVTIESVTTTTRVGERSVDIELLAGLRGGRVLCGYAEGPLADGSYDGAGIPLCAPGRFLYRPRYSVMAQIEVEYRGRRYEQLSVLDARPIRCAADGCPSPATQWFRLALPVGNIPSGICSPGLFESSCEPPTRSASLGTALLRVDWENGPTNGATAMSVGDPRDDRPDIDPATQPPELDQFSEVVAAESLVAESYDLRARLRADRPVRWDVRVQSAFAERPPCAASATQVNSAVSPAATVSFDPVFTGYCPARALNVIVTITDPATGMSETYADPESGVPSQFWRGGYVVTPGVMARLNARLVIAEPSEPRPGISVMHGVYAAEMRIDGWRFDWPFPLPPSPELACSQQYRSALNTDAWQREKVNHLVELGDVMTVTVTVGLFEAGGTRGDCFRRRGGPSQTVTFEVPRSEVTRPGGVVLRTAPDAPFPIAIVLRPDAFSGF